MARRRAALHGLAGLQALAAGRALAGFSGLIAPSWLQARRAAAAGAHAGRRILHVDSYHRGNAWNDRIAAGLAATLADTGVELHIFYLDTKRREGEANGQAAATAALAEIERFAPDLITTSDDPAAQFLIMPHLKGHSLPVVFCGLNWDAAAYGLPFPNVTGMVEVSPIPQIIELLQRYAQGDRLGFLAENTSVKRKEREYHERIFGLDYSRAWFVDDFVQWQAAFQEAQAAVDMLMVLGVGKVVGWDDAAARELALRDTRIPTGTDFEWLMHVAVFGVGKSPEEQGIWAAKAALRILDGVSPRDIPIAYNKRAELYFNATLGAKLGIGEPPPLAQLVQ